MAFNEVDRMVEELDSAMGNLKGALTGIPFRRGGFKSKHDQLARAVAALTVHLESARVLIK